MFGIRVLVACKILKSKLLRNDIFLSKILFRKFKSEMIEELFLKF